MSDVGRDGFKADSSQLRERPSAKPLHLHNSEDAKQKVFELNEEEEKDGNHERTKKTYGRTPDGTGTWLYTVTSHAQEKNCAKRCTTRHPPTNIA